MKNLKLDGSVRLFPTSSSWKLSGGVIEGVSPLIEMLMSGCRNGVIQTLICEPVRNYKLLKFDRVTVPQFSRTRARKGGWAGTYKLYYYRGSISDCFDLLNGSIFHRLHKKQTKLFTCCTKNRR